jgi:hypothetical protein
MFRLSMPSPTESQSGSDTNRTGTPIESRAQGRTRQADGTMPKRRRESHRVAKLRSAQLALLAAGMGLLACTATPPPSYPGETTAQMARAKPDWVDGTPARYPRRDYLWGVGRGAGRVPCESDARGAIAKIFEAHIRQLSKDWQGHFSRVNASGTIRVEAMAVSQLTRVSTDYVLKGSQIAEIWQGDGGFHCLAVLERLPAARNLSDEIDRLDVQIGAKVRQGDEAPNATARFFAYKRAMELLQQREALNAELRIVDPSGRGKRPPNGWADLVAKFTGAQSKIKIGLRIGGRDAQKMQACLAEQLSQRGIRVLEGTSDIDLMVHGTLKWNWAGELMGSYMVKIDVSLRITDIEGGQTRAAFVRSLKTGRPQREMALQTASNKLCLKVAPQLAQKVEDSLSR